MIANGNGSLGNLQVLQLGGNDAISLSQATRLACDHGGFSEINLNCGCPSISTGGSNHFGASLMRQAAHARSLLEEMADAAGGGTGERASEEG